VRRAAIALLASSMAATALAGSAAPASADFHLVMIREVYPGSIAGPEAEYVELQAYASGQHVVAGHSVSFLDAAGANVGSATFGSNVANGANQMTLLLATPAAESAFGVVADAEMPAGRIDSAGGAVCWESLDCVAWGSFSGGPTSPVGARADPAGIPDGMALRRTIAPGCPTLLEFGDDRNDSATDFADAFPAPRPNSVPPSERACTSQGPTAGQPAPGGRADGGAAARRPNTVIRRRPGRVTRDRTPTFRFTSTRHRSRFLCKVDRRRFRRCRSPLTLKLRPGRHVFRVKARAPDGATDRTPAVWRFRVLPRKRR